MNEAFFDNVSQEYSVFLLVFLNFFKVDVSQSSSKTYQTATIAMKTLAPSPMY